MRGFQFRLSLAADEVPRRTREKTSGPQVIP